MDYKLKYENALEIARCYKGLRAEMEMIFPELKEESKNERMINFISHELACIRATDEKGSDRYNELTEAIAWLEKQGEQKPAWSEEDERRMQQIISDLEQCTVPGFPIYIGGIELEINWLKSLKERMKGE